MTRPQISPSQRCHDSENSKSMQQKSRHLPSFAVIFRHFFVIFTTFWPPLLGFPYDFFFYKGGRLFCVQNEKSQTLWGEWGYVLRAATFICPNPSTSLSHPSSPLLAASHSRAPLPSTSLHPWSHLWIIHTMRVHQKSFKGLQVVVHCSQVMFPT